MREKVALSIAGALLVIIAFLVFAPVVPFEQLQNVQVPSSAGVCTSPTSGQCDLVFKQVWVRSYGSFTFDAFGIGTSPYASPVRFTIGGITNVFVLNSTGSVVEQLAYPSFIKSEPVSLITVASATILATPFGGTGVAVKLVNQGAGENATVNVLPYDSPTTVSDQTIDAGQSATYNITSWTTSLAPKPGVNLKLEISGDLCYGPRVCLPYINTVTSKVGPNPGTTVPSKFITEGTLGPVWQVGAVSSDPSALSNSGVRSTIQVIDQQTAGSLAFWVGDDLSNNVWGQVGYFLSKGGPPVAFYQVWNLTSDILITSGSTSVNTGNRTFSMYLESGTTWAFAIDGNVFATNNMGASSSSATFPVYVVSEEQANSTFSFPAISFGPALEVLRLGSWSPVQSASVYGTAWGVEGSIQNSKLGTDQMIVDGSLGGIPQGTLLWGASTISSTSDSLASLLVFGHFLGNYCHTRTGSSIWQRSFVGLAWDFKYR